MNSPDFIRDKLNSMKTGLIRDESSNSSDEEEEKNDE
jgi:hypothetical protein